MSKIDAYRKQECAASRTLLKQCTKCDHWMLTSITDVPGQWSARRTPPANERIKTAGDANETENTTNGTQEQASAISRRKKQG